MTAIIQPCLTVETVSGHPGQRRVRVDYDLCVDAGDPLVGHQVLERIVVRAVDEHDAAVLPRKDPVLDVEEGFVGAAGVHHRTMQRTVHRIDLDVEGDWWSASPEGEPEPIAEWLDHIVSDIRLSVDGEMAAEAMTPVLTGSWGALGHD